MRLHPILGYYRLHAGTDLRAYCGTPIMAAGPGTAQWRNGFGNQVLVNHGTVGGKNLMTSYNHLTRFAVSCRGQRYGYGRHRPLGGVRPPAFRVCERVSDRPDVRAALTGPGRAPGVGARPVPAPARPHPGNRYAVGHPYAGAPRTARGRARCPGRAPGRQHRQRRTAGHGWRRTAAARSSPRKGTPAGLRDRGHIEAGIVLSGTEVKALRMGRASLVDGYVAVKHGEASLEERPHPRVHRGHVDEPRPAPATAQGGDPAPRVQDAREGAHDGPPVLPRRPRHCEIALARGKRTSARRSARRTTARRSAPCGSATALTPRGASRPRSVPDAGPTRGDAVALDVRSRARQQPEAPWSSSAVAFRGRLNSGLSKRGADEETGAGTARPPARTRSSGRSRAVHQDPVDRRRARRGPRGALVPDRSRRRRARRLLGRPRAHVPQDAGRPERARTGCDPAGAGTGLAKGHCSSCGIAGGLLGRLAEPEEVATTRVPAVRDRRYPARKYPCGR